MSEVIPDNPLLWLWNQLISFVVVNGVQIFWTIFVVAVIIIGKFVFDRFWSRGVKEGTIPSHVADILRVMTNLAAIIVFLSVSITIWRVELAWLLTFLGLAAGTIIGFASSEPIGNAVAGFIILFNRPFVTGHRIRIGEHLGDVMKINLIYTTLITPDLEEINIPNRQVLNAEVVNYGMGRPIRTSVSCTVDYGVDLEWFKQKLLEVSGGLEGVDKRPKPYVRVTNFGSYAAEFTLYVFTSNPRGIPQLEADLKEAIWRMYKNEGLSLTTPSLIQPVPVSAAEAEAVKMAPSEGTKS